MLTRRQFLKLGVGTGLALMVPWNIGDLSVQAAPRIPDLLDPATINKYETRLIIPPAMPKTSTITLPDGSPADYYEIAVKQFSQSILPPSAGVSPTTVWSYGSNTTGGTFNFPAYTIEAQYNRPVRVKWINGLMDASGNYVPHLLPVDQTLHWANPPGPRDGRGTSQIAYTGPVPMVVHVHGAHVTEDSDGYPEAWYLPNAKNIPSSYFKVGSFYDTFKNQFKQRWGVDWTPGSSIFQYPNSQRATTLWYHDHSVGITRLNVYTGPAGFYLLRGGPDDVSSGLPSPAPVVGTDPFATNIYEIPIAIQDRTFTTAGQLFYPNTRAYFEGMPISIPFIPDSGCSGPSDVSPIWNPEFFGNTIVVNGRTWPRLPVEKRRYRLRLLNGCQARTVILKLYTGAPNDPRPVTPSLPFVLVGTEGGFLPNPIALDQILLGPAERADVVVDFTSLPIGTQVYLLNEGPDDPFQGFPTTPSNENTTGQVMRFDVSSTATGGDLSVDPLTLSLPALAPLPTASTKRQVSLNEMESETVMVVDQSGELVLACGDPSAEPFGPTAAMLGTVVNGVGVPKMWSEPITEAINVGSTEIWEIYNFTADVHPIHIHQVMFQVIERQPITGGAARAAETWESGRKDTVLAYPGEITRVKAKFDLEGLYVWHCHILDHEDNEMMRPYRVQYRSFLPHIPKDR